MGQLADRLAFLTTRYGSDAAAWQHEIHALAALEQTDIKLALTRFYELKRRLVEFRRAQLARALRAFEFVGEAPDEDTRGYGMKELEADIRAMTRALGHARAIARASEEGAAARASLQRRVMAPRTLLAPARWDALGRLADDAEAWRREAAREARLDRRLMDVERRASKLARKPATPSPALDGDALDSALDESERALGAEEAIEDAHARAVAPLRAPEVATYRSESRRALEKEARLMLDAGNVEGLRALETRAHALRVEAARLASQATRSRRAGVGPPPRERRPGDPVDPYG